LNFDEVIFSTMKKAILNYFLIQLFLILSIYSEQEAVVSPTPEENESPPFIEGVVVDEETNSPIHSFIVEIGMITDSSKPPYYFKEFYINNETGEFHIDLPPGSAIPFKLRFSGRGYSFLEYPQLFYQNDHIKNLKVSLSKGKSASLKVVWKKDKTPISDVQAILIPALSGIIEEFKIEEIVSKAFSHQLPSGSTDKKGVASITGISSEYYEILLNGDSIPWVRIGRINLKQFITPPRQILIEVEPPSSIEGMIKNRFEHPVPSLDVSAILISKNTKTIFPSVETDKEGRFKILRLTAGGFALSISPPKRENFIPEEAFNLLTITKIPQLKSGEKRLVNLLSKNLSILKGRVAKNDEPISQGTIKLLEEKDVRFISNISSEGEYLIEGIAPGKYTLSYFPPKGCISSSGIFDRKFEIQFSEKEAPTTKTQDIIYNVGEIKAILNESVQRTSDEPLFEEKVVVPFATVELFKEIKKDSGDVILSPLIGKFWEKVSEGSTDSDGEILFEMLDEGNYVLSFNPGSGSVISGVYNITKNKSHQIKELVVKNSSELLLKVEDVEGKSIINPEIYLFSTDGIPIPTSNIVFTEDEINIFNLKDGEFLLRVCAGFYQVEDKKITLNKDEKLNVKVILKPAGGVEVDLSNCPTLKSGGEIFCRIFKDGEPDPTYIYLSTDNCYAKKFKIKKSGQNLLLLDHLPEGKYRIEFCGDENFKNILKPILVEIKNRNITKAKF